MLNELIKILNKRLENYKKQLYKKKPYNIEIIKKGLRIERKINLLQNLEIIVD